MISEREAIERIAELCASWRGYEWEQRSDEHVIPTLECCADEVEAILKIAARRPTLEDVASRLLLAEAVAINEYRDDVARGLHEAAEIVGDMARNTDPTSKGQDDD